VDNSSTASYVYGANGQRVRKTTSSGSVDYLYDLSGHEITELSSSGFWNPGEVYAGGHHLTTYNNGTTYLIHTDHRGSERVRTNSSGTSCETIVSLPFGDRQTTSGSCQSGWGALGPHDRLQHPITFEYCTDGPLAMLRSAATSYFHADGLGSISSLSNAAGSIANTYTYDSFGS